MPWFANFRSILAAKVDPCNREFLRENVFAILLLNLRSLAMIFSTPETGAKSMSLGKTRQRSSSALISSTSPLSPLSHPIW
jgi:hypothetical protein